MGVKPRRVLRFETLEGRVSLSSAADLLPAPRAAQVRPGARTTAMRGDVTFPSTPAPGAVLLEGQGTVRPLHGVAARATPNLLTGAGTADVALIGNRGELWLKLTPYPSPPTMQVPGYSFRYRVVAGSGAVAGGSGVGTLRFLPGVGSAVVSLALHGRLSRG